MNEEAQVTPVARPDDYITVTVNGTEQQVFMSGGLIRTLLQGFNSVEEFLSVYLNTAVQNLLMIEALKPRNAVGQPTKKEYTIDDFEMDMDSASNLVDWIVDHILHFFMKQIEAGEQSAKRNASVMKRLEELAQSMQSPSGTQD